MLLDGEDEDGENSGDDGENNPIQVYGRPVYVSKAKIPDVLFFNGHRWSMASAAEIDMSPSTSSYTSDSLSSTGSTITRSSMAKFFQEQFHAYWSMYTVGFLSAPVSIDTPDDTNTPTDVSWYQADVQQHKQTIQGPDFNKPVEAKFLCATCSNETNPCLFGGVCQSGQCQCTTGSTGKLCHIPPTSNGVCDMYFNTLEFDYDGGDCCKETCISTLEHSCGEGIIGESFGIDAFGYIGFPNCAEQQTFNEVHTIEKVIKRGYLVCGVFRTTVKKLAQFYSNQVSIIRP